MEEIIKENLSNAAKQSMFFNFNETARKQVFAKSRKNTSGQNQIRIRDLNDNPSNPTFSKYSKDDILTYLEDPYKYQSQLNDAVTYMYSASSHFRRLIKYFVGLSDLQYILVPKNLETDLNQDELMQEYNDTCNFIDTMDLDNQLTNMLTIAWREDCCFITTWINDGAVTFQSLPNKYCRISTIEDNVMNVTFNFSYFNGNRKKYLDYYPQEFKKKYEMYEKDRTKQYQELDSPTSFCIKVNKDIPEYATPPFSGVLPAYYELSDYNALKLTKTELENYAMLVMKLGVDSDGNWIMDYDKAKSFYKNLDSVLPEEVGSVLSPMNIEKISFEKSSGASNTDTISEAESHAWRAAGVNASLFTEVNSSSAIKLSVISDQEMTYEVLKSIGTALNRIIKFQTFGKHFRIHFINCSAYNREDLSKVYKESATLGLPTVMLYAAASGMSPSVFIGMLSLENDILKIKDKLEPLKSSYNVSGEVGRPKSDVKDEAGEITENAGSNDDK